MRFAMYIKRICYVGKTVLILNCMRFILHIIYKSYGTDFHKMWWKCGTWATEETARFLMVIQVTFHWG